MFGIIGDHKFGERLCLFASIVLMYIDDPIKSLIFWLTFCISLGLGDQFHSIDHHVDKVQ